MLRKWAKSGWVPMGRLTPPADVGNALLCSDEVGFVTGPMVENLLSYSRGFRLCGANVPDGDQFMAFETGIPLARMTCARVASLRLLRFDVLEMPFARAQLAGKGD